MLTKDDLQAIELLLDRKLEEKLDTKLAPIKIALKSLLEIIPRDQRIVDNRIENHEERIVLLEKRN